MIACRAPGSVTADTPPDLPRALSPISERNLMDGRRASLPLKVLYAVVAAMLVWAILGSLMAAGQ